MTSVLETEVEDAPRRSRKRAPGGGLGRYVLVRFLLIIPTIFILMTMVFFLMRITGDPLTAALGGRLTPAQLAERRAEAGYDRPLIVQYFDYLGG
ncbi:MAG: ABC transporter permease, partial [Dermabacteraceae bacterium]